MKNDRRWLSGAGILLLAALGSAGCGDINIGPSEPRFRTTTAAISPSGRTYARGGFVEVGGSMDEAPGEVGQALLVDPASEQELGRRRLPGPITALEYSPDGRLLAMADEKGWLVLWEGIRLTPIAYKRIERDGLFSLAFSPDGSLLAAGTDRGPIRLLDRQLETLRSLEGHQGRVTAVSFSVDGRWIASGSDDRKLHVWDAASGSLRHSINGPDGRVTAVRLFPDGERIVSISERGTVRWQRIRTGESYRDITPPGRIRGLAIAPDGGRVAAGSLEGKVYVWDAETGALLRELAHGSDVRAVAFPNEANTLMSAGAESGILWNVTTGTVIVP